MQSSDDPKPKMRVLVGMTGASGALYAKRLLQQLATLSVENPPDHESIRQAGGGCGTT